MIYLQVGRMRLICQRLCPSELCALKWTRLFAEFIRSFLRLRRTPDFDQLWHVNPSAFILSEMTCWPHAVHIDMTDWLCCHITPSPSCVWKAWNSASRSGVLPQAWISTCRLATETGLAHGDHVLLLLITQPRNQFHTVEFSSSQLSLGFLFQMSDIEPL